MVPHINLLFFLRVKDETPKVVSQNDPEFSTATASSFDLASGNSLKMRCLTLEIYMETRANMDCINGEQINWCRLGISTETY